VQTKPEVFRTSTSMSLHPVHGTDILSSEMQATHLFYVIISVKYFTYRHSRSSHKRTVRRWRQETEGEISIYFHQSIR